MGYLKYDNVSQVDLNGWRNRWPNFSPEEMACTHCEALYINEEALDKLQRARTAYGKPIKVHSAYRCKEHPIEAAKPGGPGPHSRGGAFDPLPYNPVGAELRNWIQCCMEESFSGFGFGIKDGTIHMHVDEDENGWRAWGY